MTDLTDHLNALAEHLGDYDPEYRIEKASIALRAAAARIEQQDAVIAKVRALADHWDRLVHAVPVDVLWRAVASTTDPEES